MISVAIATAGRTSLLAKTLKSLSQCDRPNDFTGVTVVENGPPGEAKSICQQDYAGLKIDYRWSSEPGKNNALNLAVQELADEHLVLLSDDDITYSKSYLSAYQQAALHAPRGTFFGGPFEVDYEQTPPNWLKKYLPLSAVGWRPNEKQFNPDRTWFLGFNWAAFAGDLRRVGGFDPMIGPGSQSNSTGDEVKMQKGMHAMGMKSQLVTEAVVTHYVPAARCSEQWALDRATRNGMARGEYVREKGGVRLLSGHFGSGIRLLTTTAKLSIGSAKPGDEAVFRATYQQNKASGYFSAFSSSRAA